jgi:ABC-type glycerol-3-phosphate transport system permease component
MSRAKTRQRIDGGAVGLLLAYAVVIGLFILWFYPIVGAHNGSFNPGLAAYRPPPATVIPDIPARLLADHHQAPPPAEIQSRDERPPAAAPASTGAALASTGVPAAAEALASTGAFASTEPATATTVKRVKERKPTHSRSSSPSRERQPARAVAAAFPGYSGGRPF